jgi:hypothetical protein
VPRYQNLVRTAMLAAVAAAPPSAAFARKAPMPAQPAVLVQTDIQPAEGGFVIVTAAPREKPSATITVLSIGTSVQIDERILARSARPIRSIRP